MTNAMIILMNSVELMETGVLRATDQKITVEDPEGEKKDLYMPEEIHTYNGWKAIGRQVRRGQKSVASFPIWRMCKGKKQETEEAGENEQDHSRMRMVKAFWFTADQTDPVSC